MTVNVQDFESAAEYLSGGRSKNDRPLQNNTRLIRRSEDEIAVRLHETDVITYHRNGNRTLNSGGWLTVTTKERINGYLGLNGLKVASDRGQWFLYQFPGWEKVSEFYDGMVVTGEGKVLKPKMPDPKETAKIKALGKRINEYVEGFVKALEKGMPAPGSGDCWFCLFREQNGKTWGDATGNHDHLLQHIEEGYYVPSLALNAVKEKGYNNPSFILGWLSPDEMRTSFDFAVRNSIRKYLRKRLIPNRQTR